MTDVSKQFPPTSKSVIASTAKQSMFADPSSKHGLPRYRVTGYEGIQQSVPQRVAQWVAALAVMAGLQLAALPAQANEALAQKNNCLGCHAVATKLVGPAYKDVAAKYAGQADAQSKVMESIRNGSAGKWGEVPMPPHPKIADADLKKLAAWVLSAK